MMRVEEAAQVVVLTIAGQGVLGQIVGAAGEEVHLLGKTVGHHRCSGGLDHDAKLDVLIEGNALLGQLVHDLAAHLLGLLDFPDGSDHGEHDAQVAEGRGPVERSELGTEDLGPVQANAQRAVAEGGVFFLGQIEVADLLVCADVQGADDNLLGRHVRQDLLIGLILIVLGGIVVAVEIQELRPEQADAAGVVGLDGCHVLGRADVAVDTHALAVERLIGLSLELLEHLAKLDLLGALLHQTLAGRLVGIEHNVAGAAVHDHLAALILGLELVAHADDGGNAHRAGQDGGVARAGAALGDEAQDLALVKLDGFGRGQIVGSQNYGHVRVDAALHHAGKDPQNSGGNVLHVGCAGLEIGVVHGRKHLGKLGGGVGHSGLGVVQLLADGGLDGLFIVQILGHHLMGLKEHGGLVAGLGSGLFGQLAKLLNGFFLSGLEPGPLGLGVLNLVAAQRGLCALIEIQGAGGHTGGHALALDGNHMFSFQIRQTAAKRQPFAGVCTYRLPLKKASMAAQTLSSSGPSTDTVTVSPFLMPICIRAMSLRALTDLSALVTVTV